MKASSASRGAASAALGEISAFITKGATPTTYGYEWEATGVPFLRSECVSERGLDMRQSMFISAAAHMALARSQVADGDILMTITGYVGRVVRLAGIGEANINQHIARIRVKDPRFNSGYVYHYLSQHTMRARFMSITTGQAYPQISLTQVRDTEVPTLPIGEQRAIAAALDDADDLIAILERLIAKKRAIKQGMMRQLPTGQMRLPGYSEKWATQTAGEIGTFKGGNGFPVRYQGAVAGAFPFYKVSDMKNPGNEQFMLRANNYISELQRKQLHAVLIPKGAIVFAKVGAAIFLERKRILSQPSCMDNNMAAYILNSAKADVVFMHYVLSNFTMGSLVATTAMPSLNGSQLRSIPISLPPTLEEQRDIAQVLSDADNEIEGLRRRLAKARDVKQGMMQELLTGRTRLPTAKVAA